MDVEFLRHQFQDGYYGVVTKHAFTVGVRHLQMLYMLVGAVMVGMVRGSVGIAVLAMVDERRRGDTYIQIHNWDKRIQGAILSSFFFGYAVMLLPADQFLKRIGGKIGLTGMLLANGALSVAMPTIANKGGWVAMWNANLFMGMSHGCFAAVHQTLLDQWLPPNEKKFFGSIIFGGLQLGIIVSFPFTSFLCETPLGWELIHYSMAMLTLSMAVVSFILTASTPQEHQAIGNKELEYIKENLSYYRKKEIPKPWRDILGSPQFWAVVSAHTASNVLFVFFIAGIPNYFNSDLPVSWSASYSMMPFILMCIVYLVTSPTIDWIYNNFIGDRIQATVFRKLINAIGGCSIIVGLVMLSNSYFNRDLSQIFLNIILGMLGFQFSGFLTNLGDMSENYSSTLLVMSSAVSSVIASTVPMVIGLMLENDHKDPHKWRIIILSLATMYTMCNLVYTVFGSNERQDWDRVGVKRKLKEYVKGSAIHSNEVQLEEITHIKLIPDLYENDIA